MIVKKRFLTMLELLISMTLTVLILSTLTYFYRQMIFAGVVLDQLQAENFKERYVENRLGAVLTHAIGPSKKNGYFHFFTSKSATSISMPGSQSLIFVFDNCVQSNAEMAYLVIGRLILDQEGDLLLMTWPSEKRWVENETIPHSYEVLMKGVNQLSFSFFIPPIKGKTDLKSGEAIKIQVQDPLEGNRGQWINEWKAEWQQLPALIKLNVMIEEDGKEKELTFAFPFPLVKQPITYDN